MNGPQGNVRTLHCCCTLLLYTLVKRLYSCSKRKYSQCFFIRCISKISSVLNKFEIFCSIIIGMCLILWFGWSDFTFKYISWPFGLRNQIESNIQVICHMSNWFHCSFQIFATNDLFHLLLDIYFGNSTAFFLFDYGKVIVSVDSTVYLFKNRGFFTC